MRRRLCLLALCVACSTPREPEPPRAESRPPTPRQPGHAARIVAALGELEPAQRVGATYAERTPLKLAADAGLAVSMDDHVRVEVHGPAALELLADGEPALLAQGGQLTVDVAPRGVRPGRAAFWLALPSARLEVPAQARLVVQTRGVAAPELAIVSGQAALSRPDDALPLPAGARFCLGAQPRRLPLPGFATVAQARAELPRSRACERDAAPGQAVLEAELGRVLAALGSVDERERDLLASHAAALRASGDAGALRTELSRAAVDKLTLRTRARALRRQLEASALSGHALEDPDRRALIARARAAEKSPP